MSEIILQLNVKKHWFDMILSGEKREEYREIKEFYVPRLLQLHRPFQVDEVNSYTNIATAYNIALGMKGSRHMAIAYLLQHFAAYKPFTHVYIQNGYKRNAPAIYLECRQICIGNAVPEWSGNWPGLVFIIKLGNILSTYNLPE